MQTDTSERAIVSEVLDDSSTGISWAAVFAGATGAAALSYVLVILGFGLGLSSISPWANSGASATALGVATILWLAFTQIAASGMGGYLAGRLRRKWSGVHDDEVYFRDTAHGFLSWAVASLVVAAFLASSVASIVSGGTAVAGKAIEATGSAMTTAVGAAGEAADGNSGYFVDTLFRGTSKGVNEPSQTQPLNDESATQQVMPMTSPGSTGHSRSAKRAETMRIFSTGLANGALPQADKQYLGELIAENSAMSQQDAEQKVETAFNELKSSIESAKATAKQAADDARKISAHASLWLFVSLMLGAFCASVAAIFGGRSRDKLVWTTTRTYR